MHNAALRSIIEGIDAALSKVQNIGADYEMTSLHLRVQTAYCSGRKDFLSA